MYSEISSDLKREGARRIAIFGSYSRGKAKKSSDIDVLVDFKTVKSLLELARIERELSENIGIKVDLVTEKSLSPYIKDKIKKEMVVIS